MVHDHSAIAVSPTFGTAADIARAGEFLGTAKPLRLDVHGATGGRAPSDHPEPVGA